MRYGVSPPAGEALRREFDLQELTPAGSHPYALVVGSVSSAV